MNRVEHAIEIFNEGFDCNQVVMSAFAPEMHLEEKALLDKQHWFMGISQTDCGAVTGACQAISHCDKCTHGEASHEVLENQFKEKFLAKNHSLCCKELLGYDLNIMSDMKTVLDNDVCSKKCTKFISDAVEIVEEIVH